jgi:hypothetical protein
MPEGAGILTNPSRSFAERRSGFRPAVSIDGGRANLSLEQVLAWADAHHAAHGSWPEMTSGDVAGVAGESWRAINHALALGLRGLPGDSSLAELLAEHRGAPAPDMGPQALADKIWAWEQEQFPITGPRSRRRGGRPSSRLTIDEILAWADTHREATGRWPKRTSGAVRGAADAETWETIDRASVAGHRGLPGGWSLADLLAEHRGVWKLRPRVRPIIDQEPGWFVAQHPDPENWPTNIG